MRRRMQSRVNRGSRLAGVSGGMRSGSTKAKMLTRSSMRFSIGVPVMAQLRSRRDAAHHLGRLRVAVLDALGLVEHDHVEVDAFVLARRHVGVAGQQFVVDQLERAVRDEPAGPPRLQCRRR